MILGQLKQSQLLTVLDSQMLNLTSGTDTTDVGVDVAGTIGGVTATGSGTYSYFWKWIAN